MFHQCCITLFEAACSSWKIFDVAYTFYKISEKASKILHALQNDRSMEIFRKLSDAFSYSLFISYFIFYIYTYLSNLTHATATLDLKAVLWQKGLNEITSTRSDAIQSRQRDERTAGEDAVFQTEY